MYLNDVLEKNIGIKEYVVEKNFKSKKNEVYLVKCIAKDTPEKKYIVKIYSGSNADVEKEFKILTKLREKGVPVPQVYYLSKDCLMMEYIEGITLMEVLEENEKLAGIGGKPVYYTDEQLISGLFQWLYKFYSAAGELTGTNIIFKDVNLRNFIVKGKIYGVDFEDCSRGDKEEDSGKICAFVLTYLPAFTDWKIKLVKNIFNICIKEYRQDCTRIIEEMKKELAAIGKRRKIDIPPKKIALLEESVHLKA